MGYTKSATTGQNILKTMPAYWNGDGQLTRLMYMNATGAMTSGYLVDYSLHPSYGYTAVHITSGGLPKGYIPKTIASGTYGQVVIEGYCPNAISTETTQTATAWNTCTGYAIQYDTGLNASNLAAAPNGAQDAFGIFIGTSPDSSSTTYNWPVNIYIDNNMSHDTG